MFIFDAHCDTLSAGYDLTQNSGHFDLNRAALRGPGIQVMAAYGKNQLQQLERLSCFISQQTAPNGRFTLLPAVEGGDTIHSLYDLDSFLRYDPVFFGLTWNHDNLLAGGCRGAGIGLTPLGREVVRALERAGVTVDLSHASEQTFWDVLEMAVKPVAVTHACCAALCRHPRNLTNRQMQALHSIGGVMGITFYPPFLKKVSEQTPADLSDVRRHIEHALSVMGPESVGLGSDFDGCECLPEGLSGTEDIPALIAMLPSGIRKAVAGENFAGLLRRQGYALPL